MVTDRPTFFPANRSLFRLRRHHVADRHHADLVVDDVQLAGGTRRLTKAANSGLSDSGVARAALGQHDIGHAAEIANPVLGLRRRAREPASDRAPPVPASRTSQEISASNWTDADARCARYGTAAGIAAMTPVTVKSQVPKGIVRPTASVVPKSRTRRHFGQDHAGRPAQGIRAAARDEWQIENVEEMSDPRRRSSSGICCSPRRTAPRPSPAGRATVSNSGKSSLIYLA